MSCVALYLKERSMDSELCMFYVYIIQSIGYPRNIYTGFSTDLNKRMEYHNTGKSIHTAKYKPWKIIHYSSFQDKDTALKFEKYLKSASGIAFRNKRLINNYI